MMANILLSAFADEYSPSLDEQLDVLSRNGFSYLEPRNVDGTNISDLDDAAVRVMKAKLDASGIAVDSIGSPLGKIKLCDDFAAHLEKTRRTCEIACGLGAKRIRMFSFYLAGKTVFEAREQVIDQLGQMLDVADSYGITLCHENEGGIFGESPENCLELLRAFNGRLRCVFDMGNFTFCGYYPYPQGYEKLKPYIEYFHIKDTFSDHTVVPAGHGQAFIETILADYMKTAERDVIVSLEPHLHGFVGLKELTGNALNQPFHYEDSKEAFLDATAHLKAIVANIEKE